MYLPVTNDCDEYVIGSDGLPGGYLAGSGILRDLEWFNDADDIMTMVSLWTTGIVSNECSK